MPKKPASPEKKPYADLWSDFTNHVLANPTIYGIFTNKIEDDEDG